MDACQIIAQTGGGLSATVNATGSAGSKADALEAALADMTAAFSSDFVNGRVGERHNTYEHRSRLLRQMTESLVALRARNAVQTS